MTSDRKSRFSIDQGLHEVHSIMPSINILGEDRENEPYSATTMTTAAGSTQHVGSILNIHELQCIKVKHYLGYGADDLL